MRVWFKKANKGRVCNECRFFLLTVKPKISAGQRPRSQIAVETMSMDEVFAQRGNRARRESTINKKKRLLKSTSGYPDAANLPSGTLNLNIIWEGKAKKVLATVTVDADASLVDINEQFVAKAPNTIFHYLCRGKGVHTELWDIFKAKYFFPALSIRGGTVQMPTITVTTSGGGGVATEEVEQVNNPYLRKNRKPKKQKFNGKAVPFKPEPKVVWEFQAPLAATEAQAYIAKPFVLPKLVTPTIHQAPVLTKPAVVKKAPVPTRDPNVELSMRAKSIFGAKT